VESGGDVSEMTELFSKLSNEGGQITDPMRFQQAHFNIGGALKAVGSAVAKGVSAVAGALSKSVSSGPPTSLYGVPSKVDEECVLCQFVVQRIQKQVYNKLRNPDDGFPANPSQAISDKEVRKINSRLQYERGGRGLLRIITEDEIADACDAKNMPELFYPFCAKILQSAKIIQNSVFFQFNSQITCQEADMCPATSYFSDEASVHTPISSARYNSGRGKCGMLGGNNQKLGASFSAVTCFGKNSSLKKH